MSVMIGRIKYFIIIKASSIIHFYLISFFNFHRKQKKKGKLIPFFLTKFFRILTFAIITFFITQISSFTSFLQQFYVFSLFSSFTFSRFKTNLVIFPKESSSWYSSEMYKVLFTIITSYEAIAFFCVKP